MKIHVVVMLAILGVIGSAAYASPPDRKDPDAKKNAKDLIPKDAQKAIDAGIAYLVKEQHKDGSFGTKAYEGNVGVTGLAGLALLSAEPGADRDTAVVNSVQYVLSQEDPNTPGFFNCTKAAMHGPMYSHGYGMLFLAEAHGTIKDKKLKASVKEALERAVKLTLKSQNADGGWRYQPRPQDADLSVTAGQVDALRAARDAGIEVPKEAFDRAIAYVKKCQSKDDGGFRYQIFGGTSGYARSAAGVNSLQRLGIKDGEALDSGMTYLRKFDRIKEDVQTKTHYAYGHYYTAKVMWHAGDKEWRKWYPAMRDELVASQQDAHWKQNLMCPHYNTAIALIILQMPNERLPSLKR